MSYQLFLVFLKAIFVVVVVVVTMLIFIISNGGELPWPDNAPKLKVNEGRIQPCLVSHETQRKPQNIGKTVGDDLCFVSCP